MIQEQSDDQLEYDLDQQVKLKELDNWSKVIETIKPILDYYKSKLTHHDSPVAKSAVRGFIGILFFIFIGSSVLLYFDKIDKSNYTFIIGSMLGYLFTMAKNIFGTNSSQ